MLTFEQKLAIIESFPELTRYNISMGRVNFHFEESVLDKKVVVDRLHPNGNGFIYGGELDTAYEVDSRGMINIRELDEKALHSLIHEAIDSMKETEITTETWIDDEGYTVTLSGADDTWDVFTGELLDATFPTKESAIEYLNQEGFHLA